MVSFGIHVTISGGSILKLVGGFTNPFEKYARQIGSFPQVGMKIKNVWNHHLVKAWVLKSRSTGE